MFSLICARINDWENNREAGDLRRRRGHYDVSVMTGSYRAYDSTKSLPNITLADFQLGIENQIAVRIESQTFHSGKCIRNYQLQNVGHFLSASLC